MEKYILIGAAAFFAVMSLIALILYKADKVKAEKVLEINPDHDIFGKLKELYNDDKDKLKKYTQLLYTQSLLIEGMSIDDPVEFSNMICDLMTGK